ncbi:MAG: DJ-1/PfpI family protein [Vigna little leaf phytoplasma]|nr:DJ-1/PfpI family protein [Vigna little leaf phytoplasma]
MSTPIKGLLILVNGFEDCEAIVTRAMIQKNGFKIIMSTNNKSLEVLSAQRLLVKADLTWEKIIYEEYSFLIIPGGSYVYQILQYKNDELIQILKIIKFFSDQKKVIGAICAAPAFLGKLNLLHNHRFTCFPGYEKHIQGYFVPDARAITSDNFVTSRSPETVFDFVSHLLCKLTTKS